MEFLLLAKLFRPRDPAWDGSEQTGEGLSLKTMLLQIWRWAFFTENWILRQENPICGLNVTLDSIV